MEEKFVEVSPKKKKTKGEPKDVPQIDAEPRKPPYTITVSFFQLVESYSRKQLGTLCSHLL